MGPRWPVKRPRCRVEIVRAAAAAGCFASGHLGGGLRHQQRARAVAGPRGGVLLPAPGGKSAQNRPQWRRHRVREAGCATEKRSERPPRGGGATFMHKVMGVQLVVAHRVSNTLVYASLGPGPTKATPGGFSENSSHTQ
jgi:hypothetical protein